MALTHRTKTTHCYAATSLHFQQFFSTLTQMYEEQAHTDVHLISKEGTVFGVHRVISYLTHVVSFFIAAFTFRWSSGARVLSFAVFFQKKNLVSATPSP